MRRRSTDLALDRRRTSTILLLGAFVACCLVYTSISLTRRRSLILRPISAEKSEEDDVECCRGVENLELWGSTVKWGSSYRLKSSGECCKACKEMCEAGDSCLCNSWVFCGDKERCGDSFGQCWLKMQNDSMLPEVSESGPEVIWTSGVIFGKKEGILGLETVHGTIRIKLFPECAPHTMPFISELLKLHHCVGCHFYRAEPRGLSWNEQGDHIKNTPLGPPYGLIQGTLAAEGLHFVDLPKEVCLPLQRGSVAWIGSGPEFFISLAKHREWHQAFTVFGAVVPEDMAVAEAIAELPTKHEEWNRVSVRVLEKPVQFKVKKI